jgi:hypothetical protein
MAKPLTLLMEKEMTRKEFLATLGFGVASILGFSTLIHLLTGKSFGPSRQVHNSYGYGSSAYGGGKE